jgi:hypothetical protein
VHTQLAKEGIGVAIFISGIKELIKIMDIE